MVNTINLKKFEERYWPDDRPRPDDERTPYQRDKARVIHSSAFRRLQTKTQVMGVGEGDFHRTRLTHSIEVSQIGEGILHYLEIYLNKYNSKYNFNQWKPSRDLVAAACYAHDLGHPPFGHAGEIALNKAMLGVGGFEGNGQTLRIVTRLEKYRKNQGMNPTRRFILSILKYPINYSSFDPQPNFYTPPKCYLDTEKEIVDWAVSGSGFSDNDIRLFKTEMNENKPKHKTFDCSLMECADDIAYGVHDLEDIVARRLVNKEDVINRLEKLFKENKNIIGTGDKAIYFNEFDSCLFNDSYNRKMFIGKLVNLFVTSVSVSEDKKFDHPLLKYRAYFKDSANVLLKELKKLTYELVVERAEVRQLERRGEKIICDIFRELVQEPTKLIPKSAWDSLNDSDSIKRRVCDYIAGMTDPYAERIFKRLFIPGFGSSSDEL